MKLNKKIQNLFSFGLNSEVIKKSASSFFFRVLGYSLGFGVVYIIAKKFSVSSQGIFAISLTIASFFTLISKLGVQTAMIKWLSVMFSNNEKEEAYFLYIKIYKLVLCVSIAVAFLLFFSSNFIAIRFFEKESLSFPIKVISISIPFLTSTEIISGYFQSKKDIKRYSFYSFSSKFILTFLIVLIYSLSIRGNFDDNFPVNALCLGIAILGIIAFIDLFLDIKKLNVSNKRDVIGYSNILSVSLPMLFSSSLVMLMWWSDTFILGKYRPASEVGVYSVAVKLATILSFFYNSVVSILLPKIAQYLKDNDRIILENTIQFSSKLILTLTLPLAIVFIVFPEFFLSFFGQEYESGFLILIFMTLAQLTNAVTGPVGPVLNMSGNEKFQMLIIAIALLLNLVISLSLVDKYGGIGVAIGSFVGMASWNIIGAIYIKLKLGVVTWPKFFLK